MVMMMLQPEERKMKDWERDGVEQWLTRHQADLHCDPREEWTLVGMRVLVVASIVVAVTIAFASVTLVDDERVERQQVE